MITINRQEVTSVNLSGKGGKERLLNRVFEGIVRKSESLYDAITPNGTKLEFKKQANTQWFDAGKYHNISKEDESILMTFVVISKATKNRKAGEIDYIFTMQLVDFLEILTSTKKHQDDGWERDNIETCYNQKKRYKTQQAKIKVDIRDFYQDNKDKVELIWKR